MNIHSKCGKKASEVHTGVLRRNYQKKNVQTKISSESVNFSKKASEKPWFSQIELDVFGKINCEVYFMKSVHRDLRISIFAKNEALKGVLGIT